MTKTSISIIIIVALAFVGLLGYSFKTLNSMAPNKEVSAPVLDVKNDIVEESQKKPEINNQKAKNMNVTFKTNKGDVVLELFGDRTPNTVANFVKLAQSGFYDGVKFHRVIKGFMIQGGDPLSKDDTLMERWGTGGPGYKFEDEITNDNKNDVGTISMANSGPNTNGSQFFINTKSNNFLDTKHTVFGKVVKGMDVVTLIENVEVNGNDRPIEPVIINSISF